MVIYPYFSQYKILLNATLHDISLWKIRVKTVKQM